MLDKKVISVKLEGLSDLMFDRFIDHSAEKRPPEQKLYLAEKNKLVMPAENINSFLFSSVGCAKAFEKKGSLGYIRTGQSHVFIDPVIIPIKDNKGKDILYSGFENTNLYINESSPVVKKGSLSIKTEMKQRPVLRLPWSLSFTITLVKNALIDDTKLYNWFIQGGMLIALGTYRPRYGRFDVAIWE
jgi:hypothetical protein